MDCRNTLSLMLICLAFGLAPAAQAAESASAGGSRSDEDRLVSLLAAEFALQGGETATAAQDYLKAAQASEDPDLAERASRVALAAGEPEVAQKALQRWAELAPDAVARIPLQANLAMKLGDHAAALSAMQALLSVDGGSNWQLGLQALVQTDGHELSAKVLGDLFAAGALPAIPEAWFGYGNLARELGENGLSTRMADQALQQFPEAPRVWLWQADRQRREGDMTAARKAVEKAVSLAPGDTRLRMAAAAEINAEGDPSGAAAMLADGPQDTMVRSGRVAYLARADDDAGLAALYAEVKASIAEEPSLLDDSSRFLLGQLAELQKLNQEALEWYEGVRDPARRGQAEMRIAVQLEALDQLDAAEQRLRELQASDSDDGELIRDSYLLQGELLRSHDRDREAVDTYTRGLAIFEDDPQLLYARALTHEQLDQLNEAEADLRRIVDIDPENADALNALGYTLADRTDRYEEALGYIRKALALSPDTAAIVDSLGWVLYRMGNAEEALQHLTRAYEMAPDPEVAAHLGEVLWNNGQRERARSVWNEGLELDPGNALLKQTMTRLDA